MPDQSLVTLDLQEIQDLASAGGYSGLANLSNTSAALILSAALWMQMAQVWTQPFVALSEDDFEEIQALVALMVDEVMASMIGTIVPSATGSRPPNTLLCDGSVILEADFPELYSVLDPVFIIDALSANLPDLQDRVVSGVNIAVIGQTGGQRNVTLDIGDIPPHSHSYQAAIAGVAIEGAGVPLPVLVPPTVATPTTDTGGGGGHSNLPPFMALNWYIISGRV